jgi:hypothetical protein
LVVLRPAFTFDVRYDTVTFEGNTAVCTRLFCSWENRPDGIDYEEWEAVIIALHESAGRWDDNWTEYTPTAHGIPTTASWLTPLEPLTELKKQVEANVIQRFEDAN